MAIAEQIPVRERMVVERPWSNAWFKVLGLKNEAVHGGSGQWHAPKGSRPGKWLTPVTGGVAACKNGYHLIRLPYLTDWYRDRIVIWEAEPKGSAHHQSDKSAFSQARLLRPFRAMTPAAYRLFAADCAEHTLHYFESRHPHDSRPRDALRVARKIAEVEDQAFVAAESAAWSAAESAAWSAAWSAARSAAESAARSAARSERLWQADRLWQYLTLGTLAAVEPWPTDPTHDEWQALIAGWEVR